MVSSSCGLWVSIVLCAFINLSEEVKEGAQIPCSKSDPELNKCLIDASPPLFASFDKEYPEYNRKVRDPMPFGRVESKSGGGSIGLSFTLEDNLLKGMVHCSLKDMNLDLKKKELKLTGLITKLELFTNYEMNGNILILPITGKGKAHITLDNVEIDLHVKWNLVKVNGTRHIKCKHFTYKVRPSKTHFEFENLFNGDKFLGPQMNQFMNDNHKDVVKMFLPAVETALAEHDMQELDDAMAAIPYDTLFLD